MKYIHIEARTLELQLVDTVPESGLVIPAERPAGIPDLSKLEEIIYFDILYGAVYEEDRLRGRTGVRYSLVEPDPWLVGMALVMWQGILQGLTWDIVKISVLRALRALQLHGLTPSEERSQKSSHATTEVGFSWTEYATDGRKMYDLFVGLRRVSNKMSKKGREAVSDSLRSRRENQE